MGTIYLEMSDKVEKDGGKLSSCGGMGATGLEPVTPAV